MSDEDKRVCVIETKVGEPLVIRSNPTAEEARSFAEEHMRRYHAGEDGGPGGAPAHFLVSAAFYESELAYRAGDEALEELDISDL